MICVFIEPGLDVFYNRAVNNHDKVFFSKLSVISFDILCCTRNHNRVTIALFFFLFAEQITAVENTGHSTTIQRQNLVVFIFHLNARSIPKHISHIETECNKYDIITCSETWLAPHHTSAQTDLLHFHPPIRLDRPSNHSGGGVAIHVKRHIFCKHMYPVLNLFGLKPKLTRKPYL